MLSHISLLTCINTGIATGSLMWMFINLRDSVSCKEAMHTPFSAAIVFDYKTHHTNLEQNFPCPKQIRMSIIHTFILALALTVVVQGISNNCSTQYQAAVQRVLDLKEACSEQRVYHIYHVLEGKAASYASLTLFSNKSFTCRRH